MGEGALLVGDPGVVLGKQGGKLLALVGAGVADRLGVEDATHFPAPLHDVQGVQQVTRTLGERRVHDDRLIVGAGREGEKIIMDDAEAVSFEGGAEGGGLLDAIKLQGLQAVLVVGAVVVVAGAIAVVVDACGLFNGAGEVAGTGGRLQDGATCVLDAVAVDLETGEQLRSEGRGRWLVVFAVVGDHVVNTSLLYYWRRAVVQLDPLGAVAVVGAAVGLMPGGVVLG